MDNIKNIIFSILDPTGNITALVESEVSIDRQPSVAAGIMDLYEDVEQVGFVGFSRNDVHMGCDSNTGMAYNNCHIDCQLRMAGGEFCGNAAMSAAVLYHIRNMSAEDGRSSSNDQACRNDQISNNDQACRNDQISSKKTDVPVSVVLRVSGSSVPIEVKLFRDSCIEYRTAIHMPPALSITEKIFVFKLQDGTSIGAPLPIVELEGISHIIVEDRSPLFFISERGDYAERAIRQWQAELGADGLGLMFLSSLPTGIGMKPLVYIPRGDTIFWERSCASGTCAVGIHRAWKEARSVELTLQEPGGSLSVKSDHLTGETWLMGRVRLRADALVLE